MRWGETFLGLMGDSRPPDTSPSPASPARLRAMARQISRAARDDLPLSLRWSGCAIGSLDDADLSSLIELLRSWIGPCAEAWPGLSHPPHPR